MPRTFRIPPRNPRSNTFRGVHGVTVGSTFDLGIPKEELVSFAAVMDTLNSDVLKDVAAEEGDLGGKCAVEKAEFNAAFAAMQQALLSLDPTQLALAQDRLAAASAQLGKLGCDSPAFALFYFEQWLPFYSDWQAWYVEHQSGLSQIPTSAVVEFGQWRTGYNLHLREFKELGGSTGLDPVSSTIPEGEGDPFDWTFGMGVALGAAAPVVVLGALALAFVAARPYLK